MRAIKGKDGILTLINREQSRLIDKLCATDSFPINTLTEREAYIAEELYQQNILQKMKGKGDQFVYKTYEQSTRL